MNSRVAVLALASIFLFLSACKPSKTISRNSEPYRTLRSDLKAAAVLRAGDTIKVIYPELAMFDLNKDQIKQETRLSFVRFANILKEYPNIRIVINGYTDNSGTDDINYDLSKRRANSAYNLLRDNGVAESRMISIGKGPLNPMMDNSTDYGRSQNRRVEFLLYRVAKN